MTPQEALAQACEKVYPGLVSGPRISDYPPSETRKGMQMAAAILDALPKEVRRSWEEVTAEHYAEPGDCMMCEQFDYGAQQERERLWTVVKELFDSLRDGYGHDPRFAAVWDAFHSENDR